MKILIKIKCEGQKEINICIKWLDENALYSPERTLIDGTICLMGALTINESLIAERSSVLCAVREAEKGWSERVDKGGKEKEVSLLQNGG